MSRNKQTNWTFHRQSVKSPSADCERGIVHCTSTLDTFACTDSWELYPVTWAARQICTSCDHAYLVTTHYHDVYSPEGRTAAVVTIIMGSHKNNPKLQTFVSNNNGTITVILPDLGIMTCHIPTDCWIAYQNKDSPPSKYILCR